MPTLFAVLLAALVLLGAPCAAWPDHGDSSPEAHLWEWMAQRGAEKVCLRVSWAASVCLPRSPGTDMRLPPLQCSEALL